jgi:hypothetical protein
MIGFEFLGIVEKRGLAVKAKTVLPQTGNSYKSIEILKDVFRVLHVHHQPETQNSNLIIYTNP